MTTPPYRLHHRRSSADCRRRRCRRCHRRGDKESTLLLKRSPELRSTAALLLPLRPLSAVVPRRHRSPERPSALAEHLLAPMAAERADDAEQCPRHHCCWPAWRHAARVGSACKLSTSYFAQSLAIDDAARHGAHRPRLLPRCAPCPPLLAAPLACSQHDVLPATRFSAMNLMFLPRCNPEHAGLTLV